METIRGRNHRRLRSVHTETPHCLHDNRYIRNRFVSIHINGPTFNIRLAGVNFFFCFKEKQMLPCSRLADSILRRYETQSKRTTPNS